MSILVVAILVMLVNAVNSKNTGVYPRGQIISFWYTNKVVLNSVPVPVPVATEGHSTSSISASQLITDIRSKILAIKSNYMNDDGSFVRYKEVQSSSAFQEYKTLIQQLKHVDLVALTDPERKSFLINLYNSLIIHALVDDLLDAKGGTLARLKLYASASYDIGGVFFSLNDIENGLLRCNRKSAVPLTYLPFSDAADPRRRCMVSSCDPRIHFALNCGAVSCPPISAYSCDQKSLDGELEMATQGFLDGSVDLDAERKVVRLSMLFSWYRQDFGATDEQVLAWIRSHASPELRRKMEAFDELVGLEAKVAIEYSPYNWDVNSI